jgi:anaphase-promoting complex subunit 4
MEFARWLRHEIDIQTAEPMSQTLEELLEKSDLIDHATTLEYIEGALTKSSLRRYISSTPGTASAAGDAQKRVSDGEKLSFYQAFKNTLAAEEDEKSGDRNNNKNEPSRPALPQLNDLIARLESQCGKVFGKIALTQRRSILHHCLLVLHPDCDSSVIDTIMHYESLNNDDEYAVYVASRLRNAPNTRKINLFTTHV